MIMKAVVLRGVGDLAVEESPIPEPKDNEALVKVDVCGLCGTDVHMWAGTNFEGTFPFIPGHEWVGRVVEVGDKVKSLKTGDRVTGEPFIGCRVCDVCQEGGVANFCPNSLYYGFAPHTPGSLAEYNCSPEERLVKVPENVSDDTAALVEPISVAYHAVWNRGGGVAPHDRVGIFGAGPIGLFALATCLVSGAQVIVVEPQPFRQRMARDMGAETVVDPSEGDPVKEIMDLTCGLGLTRIIECSGSSSGIAMTVDVTGVDGRIVLTGQSVGTKIPAELGKLIWKHASIVGSCGSQSWFRKTLSFMSRGLIDFEKAITHRFALDSAEEAFKVGNEATECGKIMVYPNAC
jgi:L-iditol 2-dehydrogenase